MDLSLFRTSDYAPRINREARALTKTHQCLDEVKRGFQPMRETWIDAV